MSSGILANPLDQESLSNLYSLAELNKNQMESGALAEVMSDSVAVVYNVLKVSADAFISSTAERHLWVSNSEIPSEVQNPIYSLPVQIPPTKPVASDKCCLLGKDALKLVKE